MQALPATVIGGYLGSGKTSLVNHLLRRAAGRRLAVLVNEFGELAIDGDLIEAESERLISIAGGCVCCSFGDDLAGAMRDLAAMRPRPDHLLIESSGVAIPGAVASTVSLLDGFRPDGIVVVADAVAVRADAGDDYLGDTIARQLADAEIVVANKTDMLPASALPSLMEWLSAAAPGAVLIPAERGRVAPGAVMGALPEPGEGSPSDHSDLLFESAVIEPAAGIDVEALARALATGPHGVIRAKGCAIGADGKPWLLHTVGERWEASRAEGKRATGIVCIGFRGRLDKRAALALAKAPRAAGA